MLTPDMMRAPRADNPTAVKLMLSETARRALRCGKEKTGHDMSTLVDWLIQREYGSLLPVPEQPDLFNATPATRPTTQTDNYGRTNRDPGFEFDV